MARSRFSFTVSLPAAVSLPGATSRSRAWWSPSAGVLPSPLSALGRLTPLTGLWVTAFFSQRYSNSEDSAARRCRIVVPVFGGAADFAALEVFAPFDDVRAGDDP